MAYCEAGLRNKITLEKTLPARLIISLCSHLLQNGSKEQLRMTKQTNQKRVVGRKGLILLGIMGIIGLILLAFGIFSIFEISTLLGSISLVLGMLTYLTFILIERKLKIL